MAVAAFFDFDGTLYSGHLWKDMSDYFRSRKQRRALVWAYLGVHIAVWPLNLAHLVSHEAWYASWQRDLTWLLRGLTLEQGQDLFDHLLKSRILPGLRPEIVERVREHKGQGHVIMLVSGCFTELLTMLGAELGVPYAVGTEPRVARGRYTGKATGGAMTGQGKINAVQRLAQENGLELDWAASYAYADSRTDLPLLQKVGHPIAVYPDEVLEQYARSQGWEVVGARSA
jgi:HAD superfamily hydrolase (TIGR01490 family)